MDCGEIESLPGHQGALTTDTVLHNPDFYRHFVVQTDASERGVGAVGPWYISHKLFLFDGRKGVFSDKMGFGFLAILSTRPGIYPGD